MIIAMLFALAFFSTSCKKDNADPYGDGPKTTVPATLRGNWMYGQFSMTEYWSQNPADYIGNAFEIAIAFAFNADGRYEQYFTSKTVLGGSVTYHQSLTKGTVEFNETTKTFTTHAGTAHYKQTKNNITTEDRDLDESEITKHTTYTYEPATQPNGTKTIHIKMSGTSNPLMFMQQF